MSGQVTWARHYQHVWQERAGDASLPYWLRVAALAYGSHKANGHATFKPGAIGLVLASVDTTTGELKPMHKANVQRAIRAAIEVGWLTPDSGSTCLVVPGHAIAGGKGNPRAECPQHKRRARSSHQATHQGPQGKSPSDYPVSHPATTSEPSTSGNVARLSISSVSVSERSGAA